MKKISQPAGTAGRIEGKNQIYLLIRDRACWMIFFQAPASTNFDKTSAAAAFFTKSLTTITGSAARTAPPLL